MFTKVYVISKIHVAFQKVDLHLITGARSGAALVMAAEESIVGSRY